MTKYANRLVEFYERNKRSFWTSEEREISTEVREIKLPAHASLERLAEVLGSGSVFSTAYNMELFFRHIEANLKAQDWLQERPDKTLVDAYEQVYQPEFGHGPNSIHHFFPKRGEPSYPDAAIDAENLMPTLDGKLQVGSGEPAHRQIHRNTDHVLNKKTAFSKDLTPEERAALAQWAHDRVTTSYVAYQDVIPTVDRFYDTHKQLHHPNDPTCPVCDEREQSEREQQERERVEREAEAREAAEREARDLAEREKEERAAQDREADDRRDGERETERAERELAERRDAEEKVQRDAEAAEREAADRRAAEETERQEKELAEREAVERHEADEAARHEAEAAEREQAERLEAEAAEREAAEAVEREAAEQAERQQAAEPAEMAAKESTASVVDHATESADAAGVDATGVAEVTGGFDGGVLPFGGSWRD